jgi:membrane protease YdiL (CAAX protease family)
MQFFKDMQFIAALIVAIFVWVGMYYLGVRAPYVEHLWVVVLAYPIVEELAFRGLLQEYIYSKVKQKIYGISYSNIITTICFASLHLIYHHPLWALAVIIPSLIFGYFRDRFNSVIPPMLLHIFYNFGYFYFL